MWFGLLYINDICRQKTVVNKLTVHQL